MKIAIIGDVHGRTIWEEIFEDALTKVDKIVFLGDYMDPYPQKADWNDDSDEEDDKLSDEDFYNKYFKHNQPYSKTVSVFRNIIKAKKEYPDKVILLLGNHDTHYLYDIMPCGRYDIENGNEISNIFRINKNLFQYAYQVDNHLFTHAGVTASWAYYFSVILKKSGLEKDLSNMAETLNKMGDDRMGNKSLNAVSSIRGGNSPYGGPTWADKRESFNDYVEGLHQYVGHSKVSHIHTEKRPNIKGSITYCDVLETPNKNIKYNYKIINV